jgi:hypothetical protein
VSKTDLGARHVCEKKKGESVKKYVRRNPEGIAYVYDRPKTGDRLRPIERTMLKIIKKHGAISIINLACELFNNPDVPSEGSNSIKTVRNGIRRPIAYGLIKSKDGVVYTNEKFEKFENIDNTHTTRETAFSRYERRVRDAIEVKEKDSVIKQRKKKIRNLKFKSTKKILDNLSQ